MKLDCKKIVCLLLLILLVVSLCIPLAACGSEDWYDDTETEEDYQENVTDTEPQQTDDVSVSRDVPEDSSFEIYFLDVDQGDCAVVVCDNHAMIIDGGKSSESNLVYSFLKSHGIMHLDYMVASHPDADHIGGLAGALNYASVDTAFCTVTSHDTKTFNSFEKYLGKQNVGITVPNAGDTYRLGSAVFTVIAPRNAAMLSDNTSIIIRIQYGETSFLFTGDAEREDEIAAINSGYDLKSTVLKVGHHGSDSSSSYQFIYNVDPEYAVISVGGRNTYGHPTDNVLSRLRDAGTITFRTDMQGDIHCVSDGKNVVFDVEKNADINTYTAAGGYNNYLDAVSKPVNTPAPSKTISNGMTADYIVNTNTGKFHYPSCSSVNQMNESNKWYYTGTRDELIASGYSPCGRCHP